MTQHINEQEYLYDDDEDFDPDDIATNTSKERSLSDIIEARLTRRATLKGMAAFTAAGAFGAPLFGSPAGRR